MTNPDKSALRGVRGAVRRTPAYPFTPIEAEIKLDQNENPTDFPAELRAEALRRMNERAWNRYPDLHTDRLREKIAAYEGWDAAGVVVTPGSNVLIKTLTELAGIGQSIVTTGPIFSVYTLEASLLGADLVQVPLNADFSLPVAGLIHAMQAREPGMLVITEPHAPSGYLDTQADVEAVLDAAGEDWVVVIDEAYHQYAASDFKELLRGHAGRLSMRTFSKAWGLAGLRLGYALTSPALGEQLQKIISAFNINVLTESVVEVALEHPQYMLRGVEEGIAERKRLLRELAGHPTLQALPSQTNFFLLRAADPTRLYEYLLAHGILVRRQDTVVEGCLRVSLGTPAQNDRLLEALRAYQ